MDENRPKKKRFVTARQSTELGRNMSDDAFIRFGTKVYGAMEENLNSILIVLAISFLSTVGFIAYRHQQADRHALAATALRKANESFDSAEQKWLTPGAEPKKSKDPSGDENSEDRQSDHEKIDDNPFSEVANDFQSIFQKYPNSTFADEARFNFAKTKFYQGEQESARSHFQRVIENHRYESKVTALYAQKAIGKSYEQQGNYEKAIEAYEPTLYKNKLDNLVLQDHIISGVHLDRARCYEKLDQFDEARKIYEDLKAKFRKDLERAIAQKSAELTALAQKLESKISIESPTTNESDSYKLFKAHFDAIQRYKIENEQSGNASEELGKNLREFNEVAHEFLDNLEKAREMDSSDKISSALYYYSQAVEFDLVPSRSVYQKSIFRLQLIDNS